MTNDMIATRRYLASVASIRPRVECSESEPTRSWVDAAKGGRSEADVLHSLCATIQALQARVAELERRVRDLRVEVV